MNRLALSDLSDLPDEVRAEIEQPAMALLKATSDLGLMIAGLRDDAVAARRESGIEAAWAECEEMYVGVDDMNRAEFSSARWAKPTTMDGPLTKKGYGDKSDKASAYVRLAARYVDAGTAKVCEIALPVDGKAFTLKCTPVPELTSMAQDHTPVQHKVGIPMPGPNGDPVKMSDLAKHQMQIAQDAAERAADRIYDWMVEYKHNAELRKVIFDGARIGVGILWGPVAEVRTSMSASNDGNAMKIELIQETKPAARWLDPWLFYPARGCGEDIHAGGHAFALKPMLADELMDLANHPEQGYLTSAIEQVINEGPNKQNMDNTGNPHRRDEQRRKQYDVWHFVGKIPKGAFVAANQGQALQFSDELSKVKDTVDAIVTIVNTTVIRAVLHPLDTGRLPFHVFNWRRRAGYWAGVGVAEQVKEPQRIVNAATRAMLNNAARSSGAQTVLMAGALEPADGDWEIFGDKTWYMRPESGIDDVRKAFGSFQWPNTTQQLMVIVEYAFKLAEEHSSIPLITQGQSGKTTPDTFSGQQLQDNNANQLLRDVGFGLNDCVTTPLVDQLYEWLLLDPKVPDDEKGDFNVDTSGALALIEKALQDTTLMAMASMLSNPGFRIDPSKWFVAMCRAKRMNPSDFQYSDAEWAKMQQAQQPPPIPVQVAQIGAQARIQAAQMAAQTTQARIKSEQDRGAEYQQALTNRDQMTAQTAQAELSTREQIANLQYQLKIAEFALQQNISLEQAKKDMAIVAMKLNVQKQLSVADMQVDLHRHHNPPPGADVPTKPVLTPPTEPVGRAEPGKAFEQ